jgi:hypothetical protein
MELNKVNGKQVNIILFLIAAVIFSYTATKAYLLTITWDEAYTYQEFVRTGKVILDRYDTMSANNHILNTALMIFFTKIFGETEFIMRIPGLIAHLLFLFYSARISKNIGNKWLIIAAFIVLNVNPYMLDFFTVARGYGLSLGLMMASIYYFYLFHIRENKIKNSVISIIFGGLAVFANFVLLNYFLVLFGLIFLLNIYFSKQKGLSAKEMIGLVVKRTAAPFLLVVLLFAFALPVLFKLKEAEALYFGGEESFWSDTFSTIIKLSFYKQDYNYWLIRIVKGVIILIILSSFFYLTRKSIKEKKLLFPTSLLALLILCSLSTIVQHHLMQTPYLIDRTVLFLLVIFNLVFVFFIAEASKEKTIASVVIFGSGAVLIVHAIICFNFKCVLEWKNDADTREMLTDLDKIKTIPKGKETVSIGVPLIFYPAINYYRAKDNLTWLNAAWKEETQNMQHDYFFLTQKELVLFNIDSLEIIKTYPITGSFLAKPKYPVKKITQVFKKEIEFEKEEYGSYTADPSVEYVPGFSYVVNDSITPSKRGILTFSAEIKAPDICNDNFVIAFSFQDKEGKLYKWEKVSVKDFIKNDQDWFIASFTCYIPKRTKQGDEIKAYMWNPDKGTLYIQKQEFKWLEYHY